MKKLLLLFGLLLTMYVSAQDIPHATIVDMSGNKVDFKELVNSDKPIIVSFWATWCAPCINELDAISELYPDWQEETGVRLIAISLDDERTARRINPLVNGKGWEYEIYRDLNNELRKIYNIANPPYTLVIKDGKIVAAHSGYTPGSEEDLYEDLTK